jgi:hypothetical protein
MIVVSCSSVNLTGDSVVSGMAAGSRWTRWGTRCTLVARISRLAGLAFSSVRGLFFARYGVGWAGSFAS